MSKILMNIYSEEDIAARLNSKIYTFETIKVNKYHVPETCDLYLYFRGVRRTRRKYRALHEQEFILFRCRQRTMTKENRDYFAQKSRYRDF